MSFEYYSNWWIASKKVLENEFEELQQLMKKNKPIKDPDLAYQILSRYYVKYCQIVQDLDSCLDQLAQPQKKMSIRKLVDAAVIRLHEFTEEMSKLIFTEVHYVDGALVERMLIPTQVEILYPRISFPRPIETEDMVIEIREGRRIYNAPMSIVSEDLEAIYHTEEHPEEKPKKRQLAESIDPNRRGSFEGGEEDEEAKKRKALIEKRKMIEAITKEPPEMSSAQMEKLKRAKELTTASVLTIQVAERGRQSRIYFSEKQVKSNRNPKKSAEPSSYNTEGEAELVLQKYAKGALCRKHIREKELDRRYLIGMYERNWKSRKEFETYWANMEKRAAYRDQRRREYEKAVKDHKARLLRVREPALMEDISDEIREWFHRWYDISMFFDKYPDEDKGGSILIVTGETMTPEEFQKERAKLENKTPQEIKKEKEKLAKLAKQEAARKKKEEAERKKKEKEAAKKAKAKGVEEYELFLGPGKALEVYEEGLRELDEVWKGRPDKENPLERHHSDMIIEQECYEMQLRVRAIVDELMREELELLQEALAKDKKKKYKKPKVKKKKGKKDKKDPTANRTDEDLIQELVDEGIIRNYPKVSLDEFFGDFNYSNFELRAKHLDPPSCLLDLRQVVVMDCILPLGVESYTRPKSVLIAGHPRCGKHILANAIFNATKCVLFDLSPEALVGKYPGKKGMKMLLHLINKVARIVQPSILFLDGAERTFYKKVPKAEKELDPKRMGGQLFKGIIKTIRPEERVLVLGVTSSPWDGNAGQMKKAFERVILIPRTDYGSVYLYWKKLLLPYYFVDRNFNFSCLATMTVNYALPDIKAIVEKLLTPRRIIQLKYRPLTYEELFEAFLQNDIVPIDDKIWSKFEKWYNKTPIGKQRVKYIASFNEEAQPKKKK